MHGRDRNITVNLLRDLAINSDFSFVEKEQITDKLVKLLKRTDEAMAKLKTACDYTYKIHHEYHNAIGTQDVPYLHHPNTPMHILENQPNSVVLRK